MDFCQVNATESFVGLALSPVGATGFAMPAFVVAIPSDSGERPVPSSARTWMKYLVSGCNPVMRKFRVVVCFLSIGFGH
ncbi:hypothetical protein D3C84_778100 [compost metagenome]